MKISKEARLHDIQRECQTVPDGHNLLTPGDVTELLLTRGYWLAGATRGILGVPGLEEEVGMVGLHHQGRFYQMVPWAGQVEWQVRLASPSPFPDRVKTLCTYGKSGIAM